MKNRNQFFTVHRIILLAVLVFVTAFSAQAQKRDAEDWSIADYVENLPEKYKTFEGDFSLPSKETTVIDESNGYAAYLNNLPDPDSNYQPYPMFEMALFKSKTKPPLLVVSNMKSDSACNEYETFFLRRVGSKWTQVKREVLPPMNLKMFWDAPQSAARLLKILKENAASYHFELPRRGTRMKVSLEICDYLEDDAPEAAGDELQKLIESARPIYLEWDKQSGKFKR
ncbi:MAG: hypothetical protein LH614_10670 [Pyrinomonadaceae bacterium]|nr:hypothetical protein [Pyrinomonadaceae bacterium]